MTAFIAVAHGRCESILCSFISSKLRTDIAVNSRAGGDETIALKESGEYLRNGDFKDFRTLNAWYNRQRFFNKSRKTDLRKEGLVISVIMDVDGDSRSIGPFRTKSMFKDSPFYESIVPIMSNPNMDEVFRSAGIDLPSSQKPNAYREMLDGFKEIEGLDRLLDPEMTDLGRMISMVKSHCPDYQS